MACRLFKVETQGGGGQQIWIKRNVLLLAVVQLGKFGVKSRQRATKSPEALHCFHFIS